MKRLVAILAVVLAALVVLLLAQLHDAGDAGDATGDPGQRPVAAPVLAAGAGEAPAMRGPGLARRDLPPPPPDFHDGGVEGVRRTGADRRLVAGEFPLRPPGFDSAEDRAAFRGWWIDEYGRRVRVYREHNPGDYPSDEETEQLLEDFYDLGEPPRPGETAEQLDARQQEWFELWRDLTAAFGTPPKTVISFGADPQYGSGTPPPVLPEGAAPLVPDESRPTMSEDELSGEPRPLGPAGPR